MSLLSNRSSRNAGVSIFRNVQVNPAMLFGLIIVTALLAFEMFNYSTTEYALNDLLGKLEFMGLRWSTILSIAFCGIDFAGIARLFTPEQGNYEPKEVWYLFGAWLLAATMNAILTWWGVSMAIVNHKVVSEAVIDAHTVTKVVPIFVAIMVWVIRILIIGTISVAGDRLIWGSRRPSASMSNQRSFAQPAPRSVAAPISSPSPAPRSAFPRPMEAAGSARSEAVGSARAEPTYHSLMGARPANSPPSDSGSRKF